MFITGAGISADFGLPTYRGIGGLYNDKATEDGIPVEMALAGQTLKERPEINPAKAEISHLVNIRLRMRAAEALDLIWNKYQGLVQ